MRPKQISFNDPIPHQTQTFPMPPPPNPSNTHHVTGKRQVNLAVGGVQAGKRVDFYGYNTLQKPKNTNSYQTYQNYPTNNQNVTSNNYYSNDAQSYQYNNRPQYPQNFSNNYSNNQYYQGAMGGLAGGAAAGGAAYSGNNNYLNVKSHNQNASYSETDDNWQYVDGKSMKKNKNKKSCKQKCCGPPLWILLGLLALAALIIGLLFALGVLGGGGDHDSEAGNETVMIQGVEYEPNTVTVSERIITKDKSSNFINPDSQFGINPIPVNPVGQVVYPISVKPIPTSKSHIRTYQDSVFPLSSLPASYTISPKNDGNKLNPIVIAPTRKIHTDDEKSAVQPIQWVLDEYHPGYFVSDN